MMTILWTMPLVFLEHCYSDKQNILFNNVNTTKLFLSKPKDYPPAPDAGGIYSFSI